MTGVTRPILDRHRDGEIDVVVLDDRVAIKGGVRFRNFDRGFDRGLQDEVVHRDLGAVAFFAGRFQFGARAHQRARIDLDVQIEMRHRSFARDQSFRDHFAHAAQVDARAFAGWNLRSGRLPLRAFRFRRRAHIGFRNATIGARALDRRNIDALLSRDPARER